jgi:hypothetical protein
MSLEDIVFVNDACNTLLPPCPELYFSSVNALHVPWSYPATHAFGDP